MTREQIDFVREKTRHDRTLGLRCDLEADEIDDLLAAAERALQLEEVLAAAKAYLGTYHRDQRANLVAAIDRAEVRP